MKTFFRTAASTDEQVISTTPIRVYGLIPDLTTTGTVTIRNAGEDELVTTPASVAGTPGAAGTLDDDTYYVKIVAVDAHGELSAGSTEQADTTVAGAGAGSVAYTWTDQANAVSWRIYVGLATGVYDGYFTSATNSYTLTTLTGYTAITPADTAAATSGNAKKVTHCAIGMTQVGKDLQGVRCERGATIKLSAATDICTVIWEPA